MKIQTYVKDSVFTINCGNGSQRLRWLAQVASLKYDPNAMLKVGQPKCLKLEDGTLLNLNDRISDRLYDNVRVFVLYQEIIPTTEKKTVGKQTKKAIKK